MDEEAGVVVPAGAGAGRLRLRLANLALGNTIQLVATTLLPRHRRQPQATRRLRYRRFRARECWPRRTMHVPSPHILACY